MQLGYTETYGSLALRSAIANTYKNVKPENILVFAGAEEGIFIAMHTLLTQDDHAIVITPNYQSLETIPNSICSVTGIGLAPNKNWNLDINKINDAIRQNTRLISINFPHNPTGKIISENEFHSIVKIAKEKNIYGKKPLAKNKPVKRTIWLWLGSSTMFNKYIINNRGNPKVNACPAGWPVQ